MKRLILAIAAAATTLFAPAAITQQLDFESNGTAYESAADKPSATANYPFAGFGDKYLELDDTFSAQGNGGTVFDMYVQFTAMTETPSLPTGAKIAVYADGDGYIHVLSDDDYLTESSVTLDPVEWARLTIAAANGGYTVYLNGDEVVAPGIEGVFPEAPGADTTAPFVEFTGSGKLDNFVARTTNPFSGAPSGWIAKTGDDPEQYYTDYTAALTAALNGASLTFSGETVMDGTAAHPFEIRSLADLKAFQSAVAAGKGADKCYVQTADIALDDAWPGIGIQNGKDIVGTAAFDNGAFKGTYDGRDFTVSNFQMVDGLDYCGFFNSVSNATIRNLKISYKDGSFAKDMAAANAACGATFVGVAKGSTLQGLTSLAGTVSCTKGFGGIVGYLMAGSTVDSCTNNVNLTSTTSNKAGGIAMITQAGSGVATIRNCQNNGTTTGNASQKGGIVGYVGIATAIDGCSDTAGSTPSILHNQGQTVTVSGVITAPAGVLSYTTSNNNAIDGLDFATVDNDVATFVKAADLVDNGEYVVMGPKAAYAFTQAGTISFDQSLATATVTTDTSTFVLTSETEDDVTTYTAVAGVASVGGQAYATLAEAVAEAGPNDVITILANIPAADCKVFNRAGEFRVAYDTNYMAVLMALGGADGYLMPAQPTTEAEDTIVVYSIVEGVAKVDGTWYASFSAAYTAANTEGSTLIVKVGSTGFTPVFPENAQAKTFSSIEFVNKDDAQIAIATKSGNNALVAATWVSPAKATITLGSSQAVDSITAATLVLPADVTLTLNSGNAMESVGWLDGHAASTIKLVKAVPGVTLINRLANAAWKGTVELQGDGSWGQDDLALTYFGNSQTKVRFNNVKGSLQAASSANNVAVFEIGEGGFELDGWSPYESATTIQIPAKVTGSGELKFSAAPESLCTVQFTGDFSEFAGDLKNTAASNIRVAIGSSITGNGKCITLAAGATATVAAGKTWDSQNGFVVLGTLNVAGTLKHQGGSAANQIYGNQTSGRIVYKNAAAITTFGGSYAGEIVIDSIEAGNTATQVALGFGCSDAKLTLNGVSGNAWCAGADYTVQPEVTLAGNVHFQNGSSGKTVTFRKIAAGTGNLSLRDWNGCTGITYGFTTLDADNYTGTVVLYGSKLTFKVGNILKTGAVAGDKVLPLTVESNATVDLSNATLNGETADLELKDDGIYVALPPAAKVAEIVGGAQFETLAGALAAATDGATVKLLDNLTLDARVEPNLGANTSLTIDLGGYTLTREGTSGNGSVFDVKSGNVVITNGVIDCTQDDTAIVADGVYAITARSGANVTLDSLTVTVDSQAGACVYPFAGATVTILGGTYGNDTAEEYQYKKNWIGMAVNQANVATQLITISGGSFYKVDPALGDDSWADGAGTFLAEGYETSYDSQTGYYVVSKSAGGFPGGADGKTFTIDDTVQTALEAKLPAGKALTDTVEGTTSGLTYAQAYALGLFDEDTETVEDVKPTIEIVNGKVVVSLDADAKAGYKVMLNVYQKTSLTDQWPTEPTKSYELDSADEAAGFTPSAAGAGFYKVGVTIENK